MTDADDFLRADAERLGYLGSDEHAPGDGRGLWAYYRDHGMHPPEYIERVLPKRELTGGDWAREVGPSDHRSTRPLQGVE